MFRRTDGVPARSMVLAFFLLVQGILCVVDTWSHMSLIGRGLLLVFLPGFLS